MERLGRKIETYSELLENVSQVERYLSGLEGLEMKNKMLSLIGRGTNFVAYKIDGELHFAPSRFLGYLKNTLIIHLVKGNGKDGTQTSSTISSILEIDRSYDEKLEKAYLSFCCSNGVKPKNMINSKRKYWLLDESIDIISSLEEGLKKTLVVNKYERNSIARKKCIEKNGLKCKVCGMDFESVYGEIGQGFIHVHHVVPISSIGKSYRIDPEKDLVPVCPNCHAMLHRGASDTIMTIEELKRNLKKLDN